MIFEAITLGIIQGLTEFLPVSSSGHLLVIPKLLGWNGSLVNSLFFDVALHTGTLLAIIVYFRSDLISYIKGGIEMLLKRKLETEEEKMAFNIFIASFPAAIIGILFKDTIEEYLRSPMVVVGTLIVVGCFMFLAERVSLNKKSKISIPNAVIIGCCQALALIPGVSRSGITISSAMVLGIDRNSSARFSFLMAVPVITGATLLSFVDVLGNINTDDLFIVAIGVIASFISGYMAISYLMAYIRKRSFDIFVYYRFALALLIILVL